jgi:hypothetical protein
MRANAVQRSRGPRGTTGCHALACSLAILAGAASLWGCGGASQAKRDPGSTVAGSTAAAKAPPARTARSKQIEDAPAAAAACRRAVRAAPALPPHSTRELAALCAKANGVITQDHSLFGVVCHEVATTAGGTGVTARSRLYSRCYAQAAG